MKKLRDFEEEINKCSKCGRCQAICPVYKITGNDCAVSRGKFVMLDGVLKGDLKLNKNIDKYLDICMKCGKCKEYCPSDIDVCEIFETAKYEYVKNTLWGRLIFFLESKFIFGNLLKLGNFFKNIIYNNAKKTQKKIQNTETKVLKLLYFKGCVNNVLPNTDIALKKIFAGTNIEIIEKDFDCCGLPFLSSGNLERYEEVKEHNLRLMDCDFDYILTDCASCESTLKGYYNQTNHFEVKFASIGEIIEQENIRFKFKKPVKVTFHKPCHLENINFLKPLFKKCENVEYVEMNGYDDCCGFAGEFAIKNHKLSQSISKKKAKNIIDANADYVITVCPSCILGLHQGLLGEKNAPKVITLTDFLAKAEKIIK